MIEDSGGQRQGQHDCEDDSHLCLILLEPHIESPEDGHGGQYERQKANEASLILIHQSPKSFYRFSSGDYTDTPAELQPDRA